MSNEVLAAQIARRRGYSLRTLSTAGRFQAAVKVRREIAKRLKSRGCDVKTIGELLHRDRSVVESLLHPLKHRKRCKLRYSATGKHERKIGRQDNSHVPDAAHCPQCGLRGDHECLKSVYQIAIERRA